jgi:plasmid stability protein
MSRMIQIRNVPEELHHKLTARAAMSGMSLPEYLLQEMERLAEVPAPEELRAWLAGREPVAPDPAPAEAVRDERNTR